MDHALVQGATTPGCSATRSPASLRPAELDRFEVHNETRAALLTLET